MFPSFSSILPRIEYIAVITTNHAGKTGLPWQRLPSGRFGDHF